MVHYISQFQTKIEEFGNLYQMKLNPENRWIQMAYFLPWDSLVKIFNNHFSDHGRAAINPRIVIGSIIIKHKMKLSDQETAQIIEENPYMQFFVGLNDFVSQSLFSSSLFVEWRKKLGNQTFNDFTDTLINICYSDKIKTEQKSTESIIDNLFEPLRGQITKPRTYRKVARKKYLAESKKKRKTTKTLRSAIRYMLNCLDRNIVSINKMLDALPVGSLSDKQLRQFWIIQTLNDQQRRMYSEKTHQCSDRIVSISQPQVRPIVRGKAGKKVEFGAKIGLTLADGFAKVQTLSWDAYNEHADLIPHVEAYKKLYGYYPELVQVDKIYGSNKNRKYCKEKQIRMTVVPKGKPKELSKYEKRKSKKEFNERNEVEGKIGQAKQGYGLNSIKAKLNNTSCSWIGATIFITNLVEFAKNCGFHF